jgi:diaminopimelate epimerase
MRLTKHHGLGNDFLVLLDHDGTRPVSPEDAAALCDRRTGIGADGFMRAAVVRRSTWSSSTLTAPARR